MNSDNPIGADNQQGRLDSYLSGFADGEGSFSVTVTRRPDLPNGFQLVPEFRVSQNRNRATVLTLFKRRLECGSIRANDRGRSADRTLVFVVKRRAHLRERVIPFFRANPLLSEKRFTFDRFAIIVEAMQDGRHLTRTGFEDLVSIAFQMNEDGRYRRWTLKEVLGTQNPQRLHAEPPFDGVKI